MTTAGIFLSILLIPFAVLFYLIVQPGPSGVVAALRMPDGSEYMVTQTCNWSPEPYTVEFFMRPAGGQWGWCYIDHQANRWRGATMTLDDATGSIVVNENGTRRLALDAKRKMLWIDNGRRQSVTRVPQLYRDPEYAFP